MPKKEKIQEMFDRIAPSYDRLNHLMSLNVDKRWRRKALREIVDETPQRILDVACGTGDSTIAIARAAAEGSRVTGVDISEGMMGLVMDKAHQEGVADRIDLQVADGEALPFDEGHFDRVNCAFGIRNFEHKEKGLAEFYRVLVPGGKAVILELSVPRPRVVRWVYDRQGGLRLSSGLCPCLPGPGGLYGDDEIGRIFPRAEPQPLPRPVPNFCRRKINPYLCRTLCQT